MRTLSYPSDKVRNPDQITERDREALALRTGGLRFFILVVFGVFLFRLYSLQFLVRESYETQGRKNVEKQIITDPVRGRIFDRHGNLLVSNEPFYRLVLDRSWGGKGSDGISSAEARESLRNASALLNWDDAARQEIDNLINGIYRGWVEEKRRSPTGYVILDDQISYEDMVKIQEHSGSLPGIRIEEAECRRYYQGRVACHILGYTGPISREDYQAFKDQGYRMTDWIGRDGLERAHDQILRGKRGVSYQMRFATNLIEEEIVEKRIPPTPGEDLFLSIDLDLQVLAESLLEGRRGGIAVVDPRNGQILALASGPGFSLDLFKGGIQKKDFAALLENPDKPFVDRSIGKGGGGYPPGSVFKIVTSIAGIQEQIVNPKTTFSCSGGIPVGHQWKRCHLRRGHGTMDLYSGFRGSCDVYYYRLGERIGPELIAKYARGLGLGTKTGLPAELHEAAGLVPDPGWKVVNTRYGEWGLGDTLNTAIGQGFLLVTPLQIALLTSFVANGGKLLEPQLLSHRRDGEGKITWQTEPRYRESIPVSSETIEIVQECMRKVVNEPGGTGRAARLNEIVVSGKTGTAEHYKKPSDAWFCCYAPHENPEIAIAVAIEGGGHGGTTAAPLARKILERHFQGQVTAMPEQLVENVD